MEDSKLDKVVEGLDCCLAVKNAGIKTCFDCPYREKDGFLNTPCEDYLMTDALELLKEYKKHLQNDLENLNKKKLQVENKINCITQTERLCRYSEDNNRLPNRDDCNPLGCDACSYYRVGT